MFADLYSESRPNGEADALRHQGGHDAEEGEEAEAPELEGLRGEVIDDQHRQDREYYLWREGKEQQTG